MSVVDRIIGLAALVLSALEFHAGKEELAVLFNIAVVLWFILAKPVYVLCPSSRFVDSSLSPSFFPTTTLRNPRTASAAVRFSGSFWFISCFPPRGTMSAQLAKTHQGNSIRIQHLYSARFQTLMAAEDDVKAIQHGENL
jgi:hypothetical protein